MTLTFSCAASDIFGLRSAIAAPSFSWMSKKRVPFQSRCSSDANRFRNLARGSSVLYTR
jgi:hypothetical protein